MLWPLQGLYSCSWESLDNKLQVKHLTSSQKSGTCSKQLTGEFEESSRKSFPHVCFLDFPSPHWISNYRWIMASLSEVSTFGRLQSISNHCKPAAAKAIRKIPTLWADGLFTLGNKTRRKGQRNRQGHIFITSQMCHFSFSLLPRTTKQSLSVSHKPCDSALRLLFSPINKL